MARWNIQVTEASLSDGSIYLKNKLESCVCMNVYAHSYQHLKVLSEKTYI